MWLSPEFLDWYAHVQERLNNDDAGWERAYKIWAHAEQVLEQYNDEFHLVDAVTTLKRVMSHRLQLLKNTYDFGTIPVTGKPQRTIEQLAFWGILRPTMLVRLMDIRNAVEHEDATPPTRERCLELLDFVWYFLRSTDRLAMYPPSEVEFESEAYTEGHGNTYWLLPKKGPRNSWRIDFAGWIGAAMLSESQQDNWFEVHISRRETRDEVRGPNGFALKVHENRKENDLSVEGTAIGPESKLRTVFDLYFRLALIGY